MAYKNNTGYPSVTEIIRPYINTEWFKPEHSERGSAVHAAMTAYAQGLYTMPLKPEYQPYFDSGRKWFDMIVDQNRPILLVEKRLVNPDLGYCGQPDLIAFLKGDKLSTLIDWKTSQAYYPWWRLQGAAYRDLAEKQELIVTHRTMSVRLKEDGSGGLVNEHKKLSSVDFNIFLGLLNAHKFFNNGRK